MDPWRWLQQQPTETWNAMIIGLLIQHSSVVQLKLVLIATSLSPHPMMIIYHLQGVSSTILDSIDGRDADAMAPENDPPKLHQI